MSISSFGFALVFSGLFLLLLLLWAAMGLLTILVIAALSELGFQWLERRRLGADLPEGARRG
ncbi:MAG: hypothetical protein ACU0AT_01285 [Tranquillimonas sp.]|jgi:hypothetical protein